MEVKKIIGSLKKRGIKGSYLRWKNGNPKINTIDFWSFITNQTTIPFNKEDYENNRESQITLNWVIPEMGVGSGGHINIFRFISYLERNGIHNRIYLYRAANFFDNESVRKFVKKYFTILDKNAEVFCDVKYMEYAHGTVATSWDTAYCVKNFNNTISKFYFDARF